MKNSKYILAGLSVFCILLIGVTSFSSSFLAPLRVGVGYALVPLQSGVNAVGASIYNYIRDFSSLKAAQEENEVLTARVSQLTEENTRLQAEVYELARLRELFGLDQEYMQYEKVADGIMVDMNVMADGGLVGIVIDVGANYATVRTIIDDDSNVSGMSLRSGDTCNVSGDLTLYEQGRIGLDHIKKDADIQDGDKIVTSNISDVFLPGILIGYASELSTDANNVTKSGYIIPAARFDNLQEVLVITQLKNRRDGHAENSD